MKPNEETPNRKRLRTLLDEVAAVAHGPFTDAMIAGRVKSASSARHKARRVGVAASQLHDAIGLRVIVASDLQCRQWIEWLHAGFERIPSDYDDYLEAPKANGYRSLHTTLLDRGGRPFEVQVRTLAMHAHAEWGPSSHHLYKRLQAAPVAPGPTVPSTATRE